jgi:hypothetical protein
MSLDGGCAAVAAGPKSMEAEKEGGGSGLLNGRARRPSGRCDTTAGMPLHCRPVAVQVVAVGPQIHGGGEGGWRQWVAQWRSTTAERVVRHGGRHALHRQPVAVQVVAAGPQIEFGFRFFRWRWQRASMTSPPIEAWGQGVVGDAARRQGCQWGWKGRCFRHSSGGGEG